MKKEIILAFLIVGIFFMPFTSATITIGKPEKSYSFGDELKLNIKLNSSSGINSFLVLGIECEKDKSEIYRAPVFVKVGEEKNIEISTLVDSIAFENMVGKCILRAMYNGETAKTDAFDITNILVVTLKTDKTEIVPGVKIGLEGTAERKSGVKINGKAKITIGDNLILENTDIKNGSYSQSIEIPNNMPAGQYRLVVNAKEYDSENEVLNSGNDSDAFKVKQVIREVSIRDTKDNINPGENIEFELVLKDQTGKDMDGEVAAILSKPDSEVAERIMAKTNEENKFVTKNDYQAGIWVLEVASGDITAKKDITINEYLALESRMENNTLVLRNIGNAPYNKMLEVYIGDSIQNVSVDIPMGVEQRMTLFAPNGEYEVKVADDKNTNMLGAVALTGRATGVNIGYGESSSGFINFVWILLILIILAVALYYFRKVKKNNGFDSWKLKWHSRKSSNSSSVVSPKMSSRSLTDLSKEEIGMRSEVAVALLKIKNNQEIYTPGSSAPEIVSKAVETAKSAGATVTKNDNHIIMYFRDSTGKESKELRAVKVAKDIEAMLKSYNRKYAHKIMFGIGVHKDTFIVETMGANTKFTPLGTGMSYARKIAENSNENTLLSDPIRNSTRNEIKVDKDIGGMFWSVRTFNSRSTEHEEFIKRFLTKNKFEKN